ncbi:MAG TPA: glycoside hydrolase family 127 protein [Anaerolineaceae bacterium]|nr:glycoside hydrolase family 127 protein [Anaerolineaceae bacterium]
MKELELRDVEILGGFWRERLATNLEKALPHQWDQLEATGCIQNFRLAASLSDGFREGMFFADSDAYKWLDAASRVMAHHPTPQIQKQVNELISILEKAQMQDGYLYTYNQLHFPGERWENLQIEHELYCLGHLMEAGVSHYLATGENQVLKIARRVASLLVDVFKDAQPIKTDGHEEIEIALLRLYQATGDLSSLELARKFLERRGRIRGYGWKFLQQSRRTTRRMNIRNRQRTLYQQNHPYHQPPTQPSRLLHRVPPLLPLRLAHSLLTGKYAQQNSPIQEQTVPVGHAVRFTYLQTAIAMLAKHTHDVSFIPNLMKAWDRMVIRRMYVTGGLGALPLIEGFGRDYELNPYLAYAETCAALGSIFWNWEMTLLTGDAQFADLLEWQLYNAASVSMGLDGTTYFYDNPLASHGELKRQPWYTVPCCPSNLSRTWAALGIYLYSRDNNDYWVHQYISSRAELEPGMIINTISGLPWHGEITIHLEMDAPRQAAFHLRIPSWTDGYALFINQQAEDISHPIRTPVQTACGYSPYTSCYLHLERLWKPGDEISLSLSMPIRFYRQDRRLPSCGGKLALGRGPILYCLESTDQPGVDIFNLTIHRESIRANWEPDLLQGCMTLQGNTIDGKRFKSIPYMLWANRGPSRMNIFVQG